RRGRRDACRLRQIAAPEAVNRSLGSPYSGAPPPREPRSLPRRLTASLLAAEGSYFGHFSTARRSWASSSKFVPSQALRSNAQICVGIRGDCSFPNPLSAAPGPGLFDSVNRRTCPTLKPHVGGPPHPCLNLSIMGRAST